MRDIQQVLELWGAWVADNPCEVYYAPIAAGFKGLIPNKIKSRQQCSDDDGLIISSCMALLNKKNQDDHDLLFDYYVFGKTFMQLASKLHCSDTHVGKRLQKAEGTIDGMLMALDISLEMDRTNQQEALPTHCL